MPRVVRRNEFRRFVRQRLKELGKSEQELAAHCGATYATYLTWMSGRSVPTQKFSAFSQFLGVLEDKLRKLARDTWRPEVMQAEEINLLPLLNSVIQSGVRFFTLSDLEFLVTLQEQVDTEWEIPPSLIKEVLIQRHRRKEETHEPEPRGTESDAGNSAKR